MNAVLSEKGQVTIPKPIREKLGLKTGAILDFNVKNGKIIARKTSGQSSLQSVVGYLRNKIASVDDYLDEIRGSGK